MVLRSRGLLLVGVVLFGLAFGFSLGNIGFADYGEVNKMFTFQDLRMLLTFAGAVAIAAVLTFFLFRNRRPGGPIHKGVVPGAVLFGTGWALSGGCPTIPFVQLGTGYLPALFTLAGIGVGMVTYRRVNARYLHLDSGSCGV